MDFQFEPLKATQAAAVLTKHAGGKINYTKLLKVLYLADRASLIGTGSPITGDHIVNMTNGPVLSAMYDCIKGTRSDCASWKKHFRRAGDYDVALAGDPGDSELSDYEVRLLTALAEKYRDRTFGSMIDECHSLPEWKDPGKGRREDLAYEQILGANQVSEETVRAYEALNEALSSIGSLRIVRD